MRPNHRIKAVHVAHSTAQELRACAVIYASRLHMKKYLNVLWIGTLAFAGCVSTYVPEYRGSCANTDKRPWKLTQVPQGREMNNFRSLMEIPQNEPSVRCSDYSVESWYGLPSGELMICQSNGPLQRATEGAWHKFLRNGKEWKIVDSGWWGCVIVTS